MKKVSGRIALGIVVLLLAPLVIANAEAQEVEVKPMDVTVLWGRDAELHGNVKLHRDYSFFWIEDWTSLDDYFTWKVKVPEADDYEVAII